MERKIGMIGLGRLGLCIALTFEQAGWSVVGADRSSDLVKAVNDKSFKTTEPEVEKMLQAAKRLHATTHVHEVLDHSDLIYISVSTPSTGTAIFDTAALGKLLVELNDRRIENKHLVVISTVMPGYIRDVGRFLLKDCQNVTISYVPDGAVPISYGSLIKGLTQPVMVIVGEGSKEAGDIIEQAHRTIIRSGAKCCRMSTTSAEIAKISMSMMCACKVAIANFVSDVADSTKEADAKEILDCLAQDSRIGPAFMVPGMGFGGPCIPRDTKAMIEYGAKVGVEPSMPRAITQSNDEHLEMIAQKLVDQLRNGNGNNIVLEDLAFKEDSPTDILEESRKLRLAEILADKGISVTLRDCKMILDSVRVQFGGKVQYEELSPNAASQQKCDAAITEIASCAAKIEVREV